MEEIHLAERGAAREAALHLDGALVTLSEFTTEHLTDPRYRTWLRDLDVVRGIYRLEYLKPLPAGELERYVEGLLASDQDCFFAMHAREGGEFIGTVRLGHIDWRTGIADIGILIGSAEHRGRGFSADAVRTVSRYAFKDLSLRKLTGGTPATNTAMRRCFERVGFREEGVLRNQLLIGGEFVDHVLYGAFRDDVADG